MNLIDLTGQKFGYLTVLKREFSRKGKIYWLCQCDCGNKVTVSGCNLKSGTSKSCGCLRKKIISQQNTIDLTGQKFGFLTVLKRDISKKSKWVYWVCQCECGNIISVNGSNLRQGYTKSCGCQKKSKGEDKIKDVLSFLNIRFIQQKTFDDLKYKSKLRFDFFLPDYNCCIEYNGIQHYQSIDFFGGRENLEEQKIKDNIKKIWCQENNIQLIEISYLDFKKIDKDYLKELLKI